MKPKRIIDSSLSRTIERDGICLEICIYRLEDTNWCLSIVAPDRSCLAWDQPFANDEDALREALTALEREGVDGLFQKVSPRRATEDC